MNPSLLGVVALALAAGLWLSGRRPRPLLRDTGTQGVAALNRAQNSLVWEARRTLPEVSSAGPGSSNAGPSAWAPRGPLPPLPGREHGFQLSHQERQNWLRELKRHHQAGGNQRLEAMRRARAWGSRSVLPLLQQGLRDPDPRVMREAALAMEAYRGRSTPEAARAQAVALPRNVARTR